MMMTLKEEYEKQKNQMLSDADYRSLDWQERELEEAMNILFGSRL
jgi:hypothetical protein